jgi:hypothetical protein
MLVRVVLILADPSAKAGATFGHSSARGGVGGVIDVNELTVFRTARMTHEHQVRQIRQQRDDADDCDEESPLPHAAQTVYSTDDLGRLRRHARWVTIRYASNASELQ